MKDIVQLEINNLPEDVKKEYYKLLTDKLDELQDWKSIDRSFLGDYEGDYDEDPWDFKDNHTLDELLEVGFRRYPNEFIDFQKKYKDSVYNQTIKKHNFKDLGYKDIVPNLDQEQKDEIIVDISRLAIYFDDEDYRNYDVPDYIKKYDATPYITQITDQDKKYIKRLANLYTKSWVSRTTDEANKNLEEQDLFWEEFNELKINYGKEQFWKDAVENINNNLGVVKDYINNNYVLTIPNRYEHEYWSRQKFFKNKDDLILFGVEDKTFAPEILYKHNEILNPNHKVNEWIVTNHKLELAQKYCLEQAQKLKAPKLKM
ncbi:hypothetical protein [Mesomycoplasma ovipneumoniae]|uniref:hypothetical protein n=1 Tax=Mesomycoplasma ovipneumoniae TaxID=29562 RepID=UPI0030808FE2